jgi:hypothetical protein
VREHGANVIKRYIMSRALLGNEEIPGAYSEKGRKTPQLPSGKLSESSCRRDSGFPGRFRNRRRKSVDIVI